MVFLQNESMQNFIVDKILIPNLNSTKAESY